MKLVTYKHGRGAARLGADVADSRARCWRRSRVPRETCSASAARMGPVLVTANEIPDLPAFRITLQVNGETRQWSYTSKMIFPVDQCIAVLGEGFTVLPGDVGAASSRVLKAGDDVETEVEPIAVLKNTIVAA